MPSFSEVVKSHKEMRDTIAKIEALKKNIRTKEKEFNPDQEIALRSNQIGISGESNEAKKIIDDLVSNNVGNIIVLLKTLLEGVKSKELSPYSALVLWSDIRPKIGTSYYSSGIVDATTNLSTIFNASQTKDGYTKTELKTIEGLIDIINKEISNQTYPPVQVSDIKVEIDRLLQTLTRILPTSAGVPPPAAAAAPTGVPPAGVPTTPSSGILSTLSSYMPSLGMSSPSSAPPVPPVLNITSSGEDILKDVEDLEVKMKALNLEVNVINKTIKDNESKIPLKSNDADLKKEIKGVDDDVKELNKITKENEKLLKEAKKANSSVSSTGGLSSAALKELRKIQKEINDNNVKAENIKINAQAVSTKIFGILAAIPVASAAAIALGSPKPPIESAAAAAATKPPSSSTPSSPSTSAVPSSPSTSAVPSSTASTPAPSSPAAAPSPAAGSPKSPKPDIIPLEFLIDKDEAKVILEGDFKENNKYKEISTYLSRLSYVVEEKEGKTRNFTIDAFKMSNDKLPNWLALLWIVGSYKESKQEWIKDMFKTTPPKKSLQELDKALYSLIQAQLQLQSNAKQVLSKIGKAIVNDEAKIKPYIDKIFPKTGSGMKRGKGLGNMKQIISRTEDLISVAQKGHKTAEVRNELDTHLSMLIDKKKITPQYRDTIMKKLFR
jgi:hypothetical protein